MASVAAPTAATPESTSTTHPYTCNTCQVAFRGSQQQRTHMQSDWHRYNLKRRVASLPPLSSEIFNEKVLANQASAAATAAKATFEKICAACQRTYYSENAYQNHINSQKHRVRVAQLAAENTEDDATSMTSSALSLGEPIDMRSNGTLTPTPAEPRTDTELSGLVHGIKKASIQSKDDAEEEDDEEREEETEMFTLEQTLTTCLFCNKVSKDLRGNAIHMRTVHSLFIPEQNYLNDVEGLMDYLQTRVRGLHECLYCGKIKHTTSGIQTHMKDRGHTMLAFESEEQMIEVGQFYDFTSTYSDEDDSEEEWEDEDEDEDMENAETASKPAKQVKANLPKSATAQPVYFDEDGLHLPSGRVAGHRSLARYFRQNLHSYPSHEERQSRQLAIEDGSAEDSLSVIKRAPRGRPGAVTRANGGLGMIGVSDAKRSEVQAKEKAEVRRAKRQEARYQWGNDKRANNQKHFRDPLLQ